MLLRANATFLGEMHYLCEQTKRFLEKRNTFASGCKVSLKNVILLRESASFVFRAKFLGEMRYLCERIQCLSE